MHKENWHSYLPCTSATADSTTSIQPAKGRKSDTSARSQSPSPSDLRTAVHNSIILKFSRIWSLQGQKKVNLKKIIIFHRYWNTSRNDKKDVTCNS